MRQNELTLHDYAFLIAFAAVWVAVGLLAFLLTLVAVFYAAPLLLAAGAGMAIVIRKAFMRISLRIFHPSLYVLRRLWG